MRFHVAFYIPQKPVLRHIAAVARRIVQSKNPFQAQTLAPQLGRGVALVDPVRQRRRWEAALRESQEALEEFEFLRAEWQTFEEQDRPAYFYWLHAEFGPLIQEVQACIERIQEKRQIIDLVERLAEENECGYSEAYALLMEERARQETADIESSAEDEEEQGDLFEEEWKGGFKFKKKPAPENEDFGSDHGEWSHPGLEEPARVIDPETEPEIKALYRKLARQLHPDVSDLDPDLRKRADSLWLQVQDAYHERDLARLGTLAAMADSLNRNGDDTGTDTPLSKVISNVTTRLSDLLGTIRRYRKASRTLKRDLSRVAADPAFGFARGKRTKSMRRRAERDLSEELADVQEGLAALEQFIEQWDRPANRPGWAGSDENTEISSARRSRGRSSRNKKRGRARAR